MYTWVPEYIGAAVCGFDLASLYRSLIKPTFIPGIYLQESSFVFSMTDLKKLSLALLVTGLAPVAVAELPTGVIAVPLLRDVGQSAYYAEFEVGTPPQKESLKIDTGSPRYSFLDPRNVVCQRDSQPCQTFGTFDNTTSSYVSVPS
jgi:hypothetical protein